MMTSSVIWRYHVLHVQAVIEREVRMPFRSRFELI